MTFDTKYSDLFFPPQISSTFPIRSFVKRKSQMTHGIHLPCVFPILSSGPAPRSWSFVTLIFVKSTGQILCRLSLSVGSCEASAQLIPVTCFWQESHGREAPGVALPCDQVYYLWSLDWGDFCQVSPYKVTIFPFAMSQYIVGRCLETMSIFCFSLDSL